MNQKSNLGIIAIATTMLGVMLFSSCNHDDYYYEVAEFINLIEHGKLESDINSHAVSLATIEVIDEVRKQLGVVFPADKIE